MAFASSLYYRLCCGVLFFVAASASFNGLYDGSHFEEAGTSGAKAEASIDAMLDGTAARPYVYRQLLPDLANWLDRQIPEKTKDRLYQAKIAKGPARLGEPFITPIAMSRAYFLRFKAIYMLDFLFAWLAVYAMYLAAKAVGHSPLVAAAAAVILILLVPYSGRYLYDFPELAFLALAVWIALTFDWGWLIPLAALAAWNKESFLLFIPALYPLLRSRTSRISALAGTSVLALTCATVYFFLRLRFAHNPGGTVEFHLADQFHFLLHPSAWIAGYFPYGTFTVAVFPLAVALIAWTAWRGWRSLPQPIQRHALIAAAINIPLFLLFCAPGELRDLSMLSIALLLLIAANLPVRPANQTPSINRMPAERTS